MLRSALEHNARARVVPLMMAGLLLAGAGALVGLMPGSGLRAGFAALFALILGGALLAPAVTLGVSHALRPLAARVAGTAGSHAARGVAASLSRTGPAIAALAVAVAAVLAVGIVVGSFRGAVEAWLGNALRADLYISSPGALSNRAEGTLDPSFVGRIRASPLASGTTTYRNVVLPLAAGDLRLSAVDLHPPHRDGFELIEAVADPWETFDAGGLLVSEALAWRRDLSPGDTLHLPTDRGARAFPVAAVFRDYTTEHGLVFIARAVYDAHWADAGVTSIGAFVRPGVTTDSLVNSLRAMAPDDAAVTFTRTGELRAGSLAVFDRTFAITSVLRALALIVALVGVLGALMALHLERARELGVLRAIGLTPRGLGAIVAAQTLLMGVAAAVLALPLGLALAALMLEVVNRRSFGWTVPLQLEPRLMGEAVVLAMAAALLAGAYPAWRMARTRPAEALRGE
jgi:putative ABC transport system permease protein